MPPRTALILATLVAAAACSSSPSLQDCGSDAECGGGSLCHLGSCVANAPPAADFAAPTGATTHRLLSISPSLSDPEGRPVRARWSVSATVDGCAAEVEPDGAAVGLIFWCPGTYAVTLVPADDHGLEGAAVVRQVQVAQAVGAPSVSAGPAIAATHACDLAVPSCQVKAPDGSASLQLRAVASDPGAAALTFEWVSLPPALAAGDATLQATFLTSAAIDAPVVSIANGSGGAIAGTWRFRVRVRNPDGLLDQSFQEVVVGNRPPSGGPVGWIVPHAFAGGLFVAEGDVATGAVDPDGDALSAEGALTPAPHPGCVEAVTPGVVPATLHVRIACSLPADLTSQRTLEATVSDLNGGSLSISSALTIENRPPGIALDPSFAGTLTLDHRVEPCQLVPGGGFCYVSDGTDPFVVTDPDGDPLQVHSLAASVASNRPSSRGTVAVSGAARVFRFESPVALPGEFRSAAGATGFTLAASISDPLGASASLTLPLTLRNRKPVLVEAVPTASVPHVYDAASRRYLASAKGPLFEDPDGDPMWFTARTTSSCNRLALVAGRIEIGCERAWDYTLGGVPPLGIFLLPSLDEITVWDAWEGTSTVTRIEILDRPATVTAPILTSESCICATFGVLRRYVVSATGIPVPVAFADPDGDPAQMHVETRDALAQPGPVTCLPGWCDPKVNAWSTSGVNGTVVADGGTGSVLTTPFSVTAICTAAGTSCP